MSKLKAKQASLAVSSFGRFAHRLVCWGGVLGLATMIVVVAIQVVTRFTPGLPAPSWTEEVARFLFIYTVAFGVGIGILENAFPKLDLLLENLPDKLRRILQAIINVLVITFSVGLVYFSFQFVQSGTSETSPSLGISMSVAFLAMPLMFLLIAAYTTAELVRLFQGNDEA